MPATEPEQMHGLFEQAFNAGDIEALMALYEPDAALIPQPGALAEGTAAIRESLRWFLDRRGAITLDTKLVVRVGDLAFLDEPLVAHRRDDAGREPGRARGGHGRGGPPAARRHLALRHRQRLGRPGGPLRISRAVALLLGRRRERAEVHARSVAHGVSARPDRP